MSNNKSESWQHIFNEIKEKVTDKEIVKWIKDFKIVFIEANTITLEAPNKYIKMWVEDHYLDYLKELLKDAYHIDANIKIVLKGRYIIMTIYYKFHIRTYSYYIFYCKAVSKTSSYSIYIIFFLFTVIYIFYKV